MQAKSEIEEMGEGMSLLCRRVPRTLKSKTAKRLGSSAGKKVVAGSNICDMLLIKHNITWHMSIFEHNKNLI